MSIKGRVTRLEGQIKPAEAEPMPLTDEERAEAIRALLERAEADPSDYTLQQRAASIIQTFIIAMGRAEGVNTFDIEMKAIAKWRTYFERIKRGGQGEGIYAKMWTEAVEEIRRRARGLQYEAGFAAWLGDTVITSPNEGAGADISVDVSQPEDVPEDVSPIEGIRADHASQPEADTLGDDAGAIEVLPASPEPSPPPETPALPPERRPKPLTIRGGGLRPVNAATRPWR